MPRRIVSRMLIIAAVLLISCGIAMAQESFQLTKPTLSDSGTLTSRDSIISLTLQPQERVIVGQLENEINTSSCVCTNLGGVTVICEACDQAGSLDLCHTHDQACKDAAQLGGIREHAMFFCTTLAE